MNIQEEFDAALADCHAWDVAKAEELRNRGMSREEVRLEMQLPEGIPFLDEVFKAMGMPVNTSQLMSESLTQALDEVFGKDA